MYLRFIIYIKITYTAGETSCWRYVSVYVSCK